MQDAAQQASVVVTVPADPRMALEPATVIAQAMQLKNAIVIVLALTGYAISPALSDQATQIIQAGVTLAIMVWTAISTYQQGRKTRAATYAPQSVATVVTAPSATVRPGDASSAIIPGPPL